MCETFPNSQEAWVTRVSRGRSYPKLARQQHWVGNVEPMCEAHVDTDVRVLFAREIFTLDGSGELTNDVTVSRNGVIFRNLDPGTYNIDEDCTGDI